MLRRNVLSADFNGVAQELRLAVKNIDVKDAFQSGEEFPDVGNKEILLRNVSIEGNGVDTVMSCDVHGSFVMEVLTDDGNTVLFEDVLDSDHAVQGSEACVVKVDSV